MKALAGDSFKDEALKTLWLQRLPPQVRAILAISSEELTKLALLGDKVFETLPGQQLAASSVVSEPHSSTANLEKQIRELTKKFDELQRSVSQRKGNDRSRSRPRNRSRSSSRVKQDICYFHQKFGKQAKNCTNWFKWKKDSNSGNDQTGLQ